MCPAAQLTKTDEEAPVARTLSLLRQDWSRRRADIDMSVDAARKSACATRRLQGSRWFFRNYAEATCEVTTSSTMRPSNSVMLRSAQRA